MPRPKHSIATVGCAAVLVAGATAAAPHAAASGTATAAYSCYPNFPIYVSETSDWDFSRNASGFPI
jgi:hypothetical protein